MISSSNHSGLRTIAALLTLDFQEMYLKWGASQPPRTGLHASSLLVADSEWCTRKHVLLDLFPLEAEPVEQQPWQWKRAAIFENGWRLHQRWQDVFSKFGEVVLTQTHQGMAYIPNDEVYTELSPELDLTHYDDTRQVYFSPDAILDVNGEQMVVEIKGVNHAAFSSLTDNLEQARKACETVEKACIQCNLYLHLLVLNHGIILVENKNTCEFKVWVIEYNRSLALPYLERAYQVKGAHARAKHGQYPARVCASLDDPRAKKCPMRTCCFEERG